MASNNQDLIQELRNRKTSKRSASRRGGPLQRQDDPLCQQAADRIESQELEIQKLTDDLTLLQDAVGDLLSQDPGHWDEESVEIWSERHQRALSFMG